MSSSSSRRQFLQLSSATAVAAFAGAHRVRGDDAAVLYARFVPADKGLAREWIASLADGKHPGDAPIRGSKADGTLDKIGMTVGGIACGTVYLGGDGRLFVWDIFNQHHEGVVPQNTRVPTGMENISKRPVRERDGANFVNPPTPDLFPTPFRQGFELTIDGKTRRFQSSDWEEVSFEGRWPIGQVDYRDPGCPLDARLTAWSPFIPLQVADSSLPVTVVEIRLHNPGTRPVSAICRGLLANAVCLHSGTRHQVGQATRTQQVGQTTLLCHGIDHVVFSDAPPSGDRPMEDAPDYGTMVLASLAPAQSDDHESLGIAAEIPAGGEHTIRFLLAWHFPNLAPLPGLGRRKRHYLNRFADAPAVAKHVAREFERLASGTRTWVDTWSDSTLPRWILDRAAAATNTLQTQNCLLLDDGRFWAWEGIGCCPGTCGHVWHYAQGPANLFPSLERNLREVTDYGVAQNEDGSVRFRAESGGIAIDSQAGLILRTYREHRHSADDSFLRRVWPGTRKAMDWLIAFDRNDPNGLDGLLHGRQHNTLDAEWYGKVHALCSLYLAALRAGEEMARELGEDAFADECGRIHTSGSKKIATLFNGEYYEQEEDPKHLAAIGVGKGCYIDQVIGQWWAHLTGLGRIYDKDSIQSALHALWKYNFLPDVGPFRRQFKRGRFYALPGDAGLLMCTWPHGGLRDDFVKHWQYAYFNECMTGFEWQAATHMVMEGAPVSGPGFETALDDRSDPRSLTLRGLAVARAIHDRYRPARRNPYNEIECSDHYARAAASFSLLPALSGFHYHGPKGEIGFNPKLSPENFRAPFTAASGWGTYAQSRGADGSWDATLTVRHGTLRLRTIRLPWLGNQPRASTGGQDLKLRRPESTRLDFAEPLVLKAGQTLKISNPS